MCVCVCDAPTSEKYPDMETQGHYPELVIHLIVRQTYFRQLLRRTGGEISQTVEYCKATNVVMWRFYSHVRHVTNQEFPQEVCMTSRVNSIWEMYKKKEMRMLQGWQGP
jgi:hypothetical protein